MLAALTLTVASTVGALLFAARLGYRGHDRLAATFLLAPVLYLLPLQLLGAAWLVTGLPLVTGGLAGVLAVLLLIPLLRRTRHRPRERRPAVPERVSIAVWVALPVALGTHILLVASTLAAPPRGFDALWYHLPASVRWFQSGGLGFSTAAAWEFYPGNGELVLVPWIPAPDDSWLGLVQYPALLYAGLVTAQLAGGRRVGVLVAAAVATCPILLEQASRHYVDLMMAVALVAAVLFGRRWMTTRRWPDLWMAGLGLGLAMGTKYTALMLSGIVVTILLVDAGLWARRTGRAAAVTARVALVLALGSSPAWIWWLRNLVAQGNPLAGVPFDAIFGALASGRAAGDVLVYSELSGWEAALAVLRGFGPVLPLVMVVGGVAWLWSLRSDRPSVPGFELAFVVLSGASVVAVLQPAEPRFWLPTVLVAVALAVRLGAERMPRLLVVALLASVVWNAASYAAVLRRTEDFDRGFLRVERREFYGAPDELDRLPNGSKLLLIGHPTINYAASGASHTNRVFASPQGELDQEIELWGIEYVLVRSADPEPLRSLIDHPRLELLGEATLGEMLWWDRLDPEQSVETLLFRVLRERGAAIASLDV